MRDPKRALTQLAGLSRKQETSGVKSTSLTPRLLATITNYLVAIITGPTEQQSQLVSPSSRFKREEDRPKAGMGTCETI